MSAITLTPAHLSPSVPLGADFDTEEEKEMDEEYCF